MHALLILKLLLVPALIAAITFAGRRWGAAVAGSLAGFPVVTGPILYFLAVEQGAPFAARAAVASTVAVLSNISFGIAYSWVSRRSTWPVSLALGLAVYFSVVAVLNVFDFSMAQAGALTICGLLLASRLYPADEPEPMDLPPAKADLAYRMAAAAMLVIAVTFFSNALGPNLTGLFSVFPVMGSVLAVFSHRNFGQRFAVKVLRGMVQGFFSFTAFCLILAATLRAQTVLYCFVTALFAAALMQSLMMFWQAKGFLKMPFAGRR